MAPPPCVRSGILPQAEAAMVEVDLDSPSSCRLAPLTSEDKTEEGKDEKSTIRKL